MQSTMDELTAERLGRQAKKDAGAALESAQQIATPDRKLQAILEILPSYVGANRSEANRLFETVSQQVSELEASDTKLNLEVLLSKAALALGRTQDALKIADNALTIGEDLFAKDRDVQPAKTFYITRGADQLLNLAMIVGEYSNDPSVYLKDIRNAHEDDLKAAMIVFVARGLINRRNPGSYRTS